MNYRNYYKKHCLALSIMITGFIYANLSAQEVNYTEVNVYGWGLAINEGAPLFYDIDEDGYIDMLVGNAAGKIWHYEQSSGDEFVLVERDFSGIDVKSQAVPTITDIDHDGLLDLIVGSNGTISRFEQETTGSYQFNKIETKLIQIDIGARWAPAILDLNGDGLLELIVAESLPNLNYFEQDSVDAETFTLVTENWMDWYGETYQTPLFTDLDNDGLLDLMIGNVKGKIAHLVQDSLNALTFTEVTDNFAGIDAGETAVPQILDIDDDGLLDLYIGEWFMGIKHYEQDAPGAETYTKLDDEVMGIRDFGGSIGYTIHDIDNDGLLDMLVSAYHDYYNSYIVHFEQEQEGSLNFIKIDEAFNDINIKRFQHLCLYDINGNGLLDLLIGDTFGYLSRYEQDEINGYNFSLKDEEFNNNMKVNQTPQVALAYIDGDSLLDMIVGEGYGILHYYEQDSVNSVNFTKIDDRYLDLDVGYYSSPVFTDIDGDEFLDLIIGSHYGNIFYYEQDSVHSLNFAEVTRDFGSVYADIDATPRFADINNDEKIDLIISDDAGGIALFLRNDDLDVTPPEVPQNLSAQINGNYVDLSWSPCSASDLMLYNIYRGVRKDTAAAEYLYSVDGSKTTFSDSSLTTSGKYFYWVSALDIVGNESDLSFSDSVDIHLTDINLPLKTVVDKFYLHQNYPNPFNPVTTIEYQLPQISQVDLSIYNLLGQKVATLVSEKQPSGSYEVEWDASGYSSGVYLYRLRTDGKMHGVVKTRKLVLLN